MNKNKKTKEQCQYNERVDPLGHYYCPWSEDVLVFLRLYYCHPPRLVIIISGLYRPASLYYRPSAATSARRRFYPR